DFSAVALIGTTGVIVGGGGTVLWTEDGGRNWKRSETPPGITVDFSAVALTGTEGVVVGKKYTILRTVNGGKKWNRGSTQVSAGYNPEYNLAAVTLDGGNGIAVGEHGSILWSEDGGQSWKDPTAYTLATAPEFTVVKLVGLSGVAIGSGEVFATRNAG